MSQLVVIDADGVRIPFLRGILTRSLQDCGLPFEEAYRVAAEVRDEVAAEAEITSVELRRRVAERLTDPAVAERYRNPAVLTPTILVRHTSGETTPFSRGRLRFCLESCAILPDLATNVAIRVHGRLMGEGVTEISVRRLQRFTYDLLAQEHGEEAAQRYLVWELFRRSGRPLLVLIGGATGCGKTTLATRLAHMLEFMRMQSTDMLRQVMRVMTPQSLLPVLHLDSFRAWEALPSTDGAAGPVDLDTRIARGYLQQAELLAVACEAAIRRAVEENVSLILEGVHVHPSLVERIPPDLDAIVVPVMLAVLKPDLLRQRLKGRVQEERLRAQRRHVEHDDSIWRLQTFLLSEADRAGIPIIVNDDRDRTIQQINERIIAVLARSFWASPEEVFAA